MGYTQDNCIALGATRIAVGLSAIIKVLKLLSGGSLEIATPPIALSGSSATGWATGYLLGTTEAFSIGGPATFYLAASGATAVATLAFQYSAGVSLGI